MAELSSRWRVVVAGSTMGAVLVAAIILLRQDTEPPAPAAAPTTTAAEEPAVPQLRTAGVVDEQHWFGLWGQCRGTREQRCAHSLVESTPAGKAFRELPEPLRGERTMLPIGLTVLGPRQLTVQAEAGARWFSGDSGASWTPVTGEAEAVERIPPGGLLEQYCDPEPNCVPRVMVLLPGSGRLAPLRTQPQLDQAHATPFPDAQGRWRLIGRKDGRLVVATSADDGRGWQLAELPRPRSGPLSYAEVASHGRTVYLRTVSYTKTDDNTDVEGTALYRLAGADWELVWESSRADRSPRGLTSLLVRADGQFASNDHDGLSWVLDAGAREFRRAGPGEKLPATSSVQQVRNGFLMFEGSILRFSVDGRNWRELHP